MKATGPKLNIKCDIYLTFWKEETLEALKISVMDVGLDQGSVEHVKNVIL